jgi:MYXO-CTERM domain-containing protein
MLDWTRLGANYTDVVGRAADSPVANGKAFVTEYAGPAAIVGSTPIASTTWNASAFVSANAVDVVNLLRQQGLVFCGNGFCRYYHPLVLPLLREFLPAPANLSPPSAEGGAAALDAGGSAAGATLNEGAFYSCLSCYASAIDTTKWSATGFASALSSRIIDPARHADSLLANWPYLTRMFTTISPAEMTVDPEFLEHDGLPTVRVSGSSVQRVTCAGARGVALPDGRQVALTPTGTWPGFSALMPFAERIEEYPPVGDAIVLVDNTERINSQLKTWNDTLSWPPPAVSTGSGGSGGTSGISGSGGVPSTSGSGGASGAAGRSTVGPGGSSGTGGSGGASFVTPDDNANPSATASAGCGCRTSRAPGGASAAFAGTALLGALVARRRRRR